MPAIPNRGALLFARWLAEEGLSQARAAERLKIAKSYIGILVNSRNKPSLVLAARIEEVTGGRIPCRSWTEPLAA